MLIIILCLPTPLKKIIILTYLIKNTMQKMLAYLGKGKLLILESSTYPGRPKNNDTFLKNLISVKIF